MERIFILQVGLSLSCKFCKICTAPFADCLVSGRTAEIQSLFSLPFFIAFYNTAVAQGWSGEVAISFVSLNSHRVTARLLTWHHFGTLNAYIS